MKREPRGVRPVTPAPVVHLLLAGHEIRASTWCWRPDGTDTGLLVHTRSGGGWAATGGDRREQHLAPGDTVVWTPGAPHDFGCTASDGSWEIVWMHVQPPVGWPDWRAWPTLGPGVHWVADPGPSFRLRIDQALGDAVAHANSPAPHASRLAMNALERALLWLDTAAPSEGSRIDGRLHDVLDFVARRLASPLDVAALARVANLSPSRFSHLFTEQLGVSPARYVEQRRIEKAQHLLTSTAMTVGAVARACGFSNQFYFATRFRACTGSDPTSWRTRIDSGR